MFRDFKIQIPKLPFKLFLATLFTFMGQFAFTQQVVNDDCTGAINIPSVDEYCSDPLEFSNIGATADDNLPLTGTAQGCFQTHENGVWFSFVPSEPAVTIGIFADPGPNMIARTNMSLYEGSCPNGFTLVSCSTGSGQDDQLVVTDLTIGQRYYLLVESEISDIEFTLCIDDFVAPRAPESDCPDAVVLCDESSFTIEQLLGEGNITNELTGPCIDPSRGQDQERASAWYVWTCDEPGTLEFTITPGNIGNENEDIDFLVYELPGGLTDCENRIALRCMLSGETLNNPPELNAPCLGPTGLMAGETDTEETAGCSQGDNNFLAPLDMVSGVSYGLLINNFSQTGFGFSIDFGGTGTFLGPEPDFDLFALEAFECDKRLEINNNSSSLTDPIINYAWNFGLDATPQNASGEGPHEILYTSFGEKSIALTVESSRGCIVTKILDVDIAACCADTSTLAIADPDVIDLTCADSQDGAFSLVNSGIGGAPEYQFSINGSDFDLRTTYGNLLDGEYQIFIQDRKGCIDSTIIEITAPPPILTDAGIDLTVDLGTSDQLIANYSPMNPGDMIEWSPPEGLSCTDCLSPTVLSPGTTVYTFTVTDENGCTSQDFVTVTTRIIRPIFRPNVITPTKGGVNSSLVLGFGPQAELVEEFCVFDRWGNIIFACNDIEPNDPSKGWDGRVGTCDGEFRDLVDSGVYVWMARVRFIDGEIITYSDDVTVLK